MALRPRKDIVDPRYLYYLLSTPQTRDSISDLHVGTLIPHFKKHDFAQLKLRLHKDRAAQQAIAEVLGALDDKIAANRALVATTLDLGSAICERAAQTGRSAQVADVAEFHNRKRIPLSARERSERLGSVPYWGANGQLGWVDEAIFDDNYVLIGEDGSVVTEQGTPVIHNLWGPAWVNNHAHVLSGKGISTDLLYFVLRRAHVADAVTGAVQPKLSMGKLKAVQIRLPDDSALPKVDARATSLLQQTRALEAESATLASLRDTLLPALMDGTIRVKDAIATAEEVL
ncbi:Type I restriction-modification system, specificity subunit S [Luteococcus japonicus LSP_Lj1]|uniref:Type I restriction-modification system, specificity subunit S n=1 Tax=Luteococcus japonicus LSP_Lj1 TaxID=1255658 RepID=A0A1R4KKE5_9ACTN|nr:Type I restriction-modification system, specificity subunit S [Luteococcus japonicus LSP_Lj1]